jgi:hypothetical protein
MLVDVPAAIQEILSKTRLKGVLLADSSKISYEDTLAM